MKRMLLSMVVALGLTGCAATSDLPTDYVLDPKQPEGLAIISLTLSGKPLEGVSSFEYRLRMLTPKDGEAVIARPYFESPKQHARGVSRLTSRADGDRRIVVKGPNSIEPLDLREDATAGRVTSLRLPAGAYEFYTWALKDPAGQSGGTEYGPQRPFSYQFVVKPGRATYIGQLDLHLSEWKTQKITVEDRRERDLALLRKKVPSIGETLVAFEVGRVRP
mgnify:CR=1 FL=1|tara:strand:+ start:90846 stop:91505 length:660 start_codon:yes stop_codon:yes gene_type:complete